MVLRVYTPLIHVESTIRLWSVMLTARKHARVSLSTTTELCQPFRPPRPKEPCGFRSLTHVDRYRLVQCAYCVYFSQPGAAVNPISLLIRRSRVQSQAHTVPCTLTVYHTSILSHRFFILLCSILFRPTLPAGSACKLAQCDDASASEAGGDGSRFSFTFLTLAPSLWCHSSQHC